MKYVLVAVAIAIAIGSLLTSNYLTRDLRQEEEERMAIWAEAMRSLNEADENTDILLVLKVINGNNTIPVIVLDQDGNVQTHRNVTIRHAANEADSLATLLRMARTMEEAGNALRIYPSQNMGPGDEDTYMQVCYAPSLMLRRLALFPYVQWGVVITFVLVALFALLSATRAEQNKVWVGLSKETAHQLGTPISSLIGWTEVLSTAHPDDPYLPEMEKDVKRLERIAERFSKIGSIPEPRLENLCDLLQRVTEYMDRRTSNHVLITCDTPTSPLNVRLCAPLFEWVAENLCKNAVDAMAGSGSIHIRAWAEPGSAIVEISDTGKGIPKRLWKRVFRPGFTTKERGWGLGLSLAQRIVVQYHKGRIYVNSSEPGKGTTFRIELPT